MIHVKHVNTTRQLAEIFTNGYSQEADRHNWHYWSTSWLTPHLLKESNLSVSSAFVNPSVSSKSKRARTSFAASARAKQNPVHCAVMIAKKKNDKNADTDYHTVPPPEYRTGGDSEREDSYSQILKKNTMTATEAPSSGLLEVAVASWSSGRGKCVIILTLMEKITSGSSMIWRRISSHRARRSTNFYSRKLDSICAGFVKYPNNLQDFPLNVAIWSHFTSDCLWASSWLRQDHDDFKRKAMNKTLHKNTRFDTARATTSANTDRTQRFIHYAGIAGTGTHFVGQELRCWVIQLQNWSKMNFHVSSDSTLCVGVSNPDPSNNWAIQSKRVSCDRAVCGQPSFSRDTMHSQRHCRCETRCYGLEPSLAPYVLGNSGNKASEEHQLRSDETKQKLCAHNRMHAMHSPRKVKPFCHLTRKGPLLEKANCCVISQERDCSLNRQRPQTQLSQQITKCEWISGTLSQHVAWLCDSRFLSQAVLYLPKRGQAVL